MENINIYATCERTIAHSPEVEQALGDEAFKITVLARSKLASHFHDGDHRITQTKGKVDHFVNLEGPSALSVEEGHFSGKGLNTVYVEGLHILRDSVGARVA
jgi:hypothetical protein